jgi:hypothetical protein
MRSTQGVRVSVTVASVFCTWLAWLPEAIAAPVLRSAAIQINVMSPTSCEVGMVLAVEGGSEIEHRVAAFDGSEIALLTVRNAQPVSAPRVINRTQSLVLRPESKAYEFRYSVQQADAQAYRCPLWLPTVATDGELRAVRLDIELPPSATPGSAFPAFTWDGTRGSTTLGHVPAFVRYVYTLPGEAPAWDVRRVMDVSAIAMFVVASVWWIRRRLA